MRVEILYPSVANLYGEAEEVRYLQMCLPDAEFILTGVNDTPAFAVSKVDMIYMGPMSEKSQEKVIEKLTPYAEKLAELIENGTVFLVIGNALEIFGQYIENEDGTKVNCLGLFSTYARRRMMKRYNSLFLGSFGETKIVGFKAQFSHSYGDNENEYLFDCIKGSGINPDSKKEGLHRNNFLATYLLGPLLIMNPDFSKYLFSLLGRDSSPLPAENAIRLAYEKRLAEFENPEVKLD